jgi:hypothetical protein
LIVGAAGAANPSEVSTAVRDGRAAVTRDLKDPSSVQFRNLFVVKKPFKSDDGKTYQLYALCGELNAKNSYGGYAGFRRFTATTDVAFIEKEDDAGVFERSAWRMNCTEGQRLPAK